jgi:hypothetical protein
VHSGSPAIFCQLPAEADYGSGKMAALTVVFYAYVGYGRYVYGYVQFAYRNSE